MFVVFSFIVVLVKLSIILYPVHFFMNWNHCNLSLFCNKPPNFLPSLLFSWVFYIKNSNQRLHNLLFRFSVILGNVFISKINLLRYAFRILGNINTIFNPGFYFASHFVCSFLNPSKISYSMCERNNRFCSYWLIFRNKGHNSNNVI